MKVVFLRAYDFPIGGASQNRLLAICRGLLHNGVDVEVHQYTGSKLNIPENLKAKQKFKEVLIYNHSYFLSPCRNKLTQVFSIIWGIIATLIAIIKSNRDKKIDYIFVNSPNNLYLSIFWTLSKLCNSKLGRDLNEFPQYRFSGEKISIVNLLRERVSYRWFDRVFFISTNLYKFYKPLMKKKSKCLILPVSVDIERFPYCKPVNNDCNNITYCGDLSQSKDGVIDLLKAFSLLLGDYPQYRLNLIGKNTSESFTKKLVEICRNLDIFDRVNFIGYVSYEKIPSILYDSRLLVLSRPDNLQAAGGFPTKLGEYLLTGVPVCVTPLDNLLVYLKHNKNAYIAESFCYKDFFKIMSYALNDEQASNIGKNGRQLALTKFSHIEQGKLIINFLDEE